MATYRATSLEDIARMFDQHASTGLRFSCGEDARPLLIEQWNTRKAKPIPLDEESLASCVVLLHRMLEAPTSQISVGWKNAIGPALLALNA